MSHIVI